MFVKSAINTLFLSNVQRTFFSSSRRLVCVSHTGCRKLAQYRLPNLTVHRALCAAASTPTNSATDTESIVVQSTEGNVVTTHDRRVEDELYGKISIEVKGHDPAVLNSYCSFCSMAATALDINLTDILTPPKVIKRMSLLKSVFAKKQHFRQYESRTHYREIELVQLTGSTADTYLEYLQRNLPEGVAMKVTTHLRERLPDHIQPDEATVERLNQEMANQSNERELYMEDIADTRERNTIAKDKAILKLEEDFNRLKSVKVRRQDIAKRLVIDTDEDESSQPSKYQFFKTKEIKEIHRWGEYKNKFEYKEDE